MFEDEDETAFQRQLAYIQSLPEGDEKSRLLADLSRDYAGRGDLLGEQYAQASTDFTSAMEMPEAQVAGPSDNPFAITVGPNALQYAAQGLRAYDANKRRNTAEEGLTGLSEGKERGLGGVMAQGAKQKAMADTLRKPMAGGFGSLGMSPEEEELLMRRRMGI